MWRRGSRVSSTVQDIYDRIRKSQDEQRQQERLEVSNQLDPNDYDRAARVWAVEAHTKLPYDVVDADLDNLEDQLKRQAFNYEEYTDQVNGAPAFNRFVSENPYHLSVLKRDHKELPALERAYRRMSLGWQSGWAMTEISEIRDRQLANFENPDNEADKKRLEELSRYTEASGTYFGADNWFAKLLVGTAQQVPIQGWLLWESKEEAAIGAGVGTAYGAAVGSGAAGVGALPGAATGFVTGAGKGFLVGRTEAAFRLERGLAYDEYLNMGLNEEEARWAATAVGGVNAVPGFDRIMNDRVGGVINSVLTKPTMRQAVARASLQYGETIATELVTEVMQEATLMAAGEILKANERDRGNMDPQMRPMGGEAGFTNIVTSGEFWDRVGDIAAHTLYGVGLIGGMGPTATLIRDTNAAYRSNRFGTVLDRLGEAAEKSETRKNVPTMWTKFIANLTKDNETVLVDKEGFTEYFQSQGMDPEQVAASIGVKDLKDQMEDPGTSDLRIPARQYLEKVAPSRHHKGLKQDIRQAAGEYTIREAAAIEAATPKALKDINENIEKVNGEDAAVDAEIINDVKQQLIEAHTMPDAAERQATIMVGIANLARRMRQDPRELYNEVFAGVVAEGKQAPGQDVDIFVDPYLDTLRAGTLPSQRDIFGPSLIDEIKRVGGLAPDPELDARDVGKQIRGLIKDTGDTLDGIAEMAAEQGFIAERDPELLLEAILREGEGELIFGNQFTINEEARALRDKLDELSNILDQAGIDLQDMTNPEVREAMEKLDVYDQLDDTDIDLDELDELTKNAVTSMLHDPALQARAAAMLPELALTQEFGDIKFRDRVVLQTKAGPMEGVRTRSAQKEFDKAVKRRSVLDKLKDCMSG
jgi:hypothetical protein